MKKILILFSLFGSALLTAFPALAMDSAALLSDPVRYRVISVQNGSVVYADTESIQAIQTMDYPGSLETLSSILYEEVYDTNIDAMAFQENRLVSRINKYDAAFHADKRNGSFTLDAVLTAAYLPDGQDAEAADRTMQCKNVKELFINVRRAAMTSRS